MSLCTTYYCIFKKILFFCTICELLEIFGEITKMWVFVQLLTVHVRRHDLFCTIYELL